MNEHGAAPKRTIVAFDGSALGWHMLDWAAEEAAAHDVPLLIIHCWKGPRVPNQRGASRPGRGSARAAARRGGAPPVTRATAALFAKALERGRATHPPVPVEGRLVRGDPATELANAAEPGDLLVVGQCGNQRGDKSHGRSPSTAARLVAHTPCEVVVFPAQPPVAGEGPFPGHVVAVLGDSADPLVVSRALCEAKARQLPVSIVRAGKDDSPTLGSGRSRVPAPTALAPEGRGNGQPSWHLTHPDFAVRSHIPGSVASVAQEVSAGAALVVLTRAHESTRSLTDTVLDGITCPVVVPPVVPKETSMTTVPQVLPPARRASQFS